VPSGIAIGEDERIDTAQRRMPREDAGRGLATERREAHGAARIVAEQEADSAVAEAAQPVVEENGTGRAARIAATHRVSEV